MARETTQILEGALEADRLKIARVQRLKKRPNAGHRGPPVDNEGTHRLNDSDQVAGSAYNFERENDAGEWKPPSNLDIPPPPPGIRFRWVRVIGGRDGTDTANVMRVQKQGWRPVKKENVSSGWRDPPITSSSQFAGCIGVRELVLFWIPERLAKQRNAHYRGQVDRQLDAVNNDLFKLNHSKMPLFNKSRSKVEFARRKASVAADEPVDDAGE